MSASDAPGNERDLPPHQCPEVLGAEGGSCECFPSREQMAEVEELRRRLAEIMRRKEEDKARIRAAVDILKEF